MDAVRLPKELYYVSRVMQSDTPDIHIIGHWTYPAESTVKTMYVAANHCDAVELFVNGKSLGKSTTPRNGYLFELPQVKFEPGKISAVATANGKTVAQEPADRNGGRCEGHQAHAARRPERFAGRRFGRGFL